MPSWNDNTIPAANLPDRELELRKAEQFDTGGSVTASTDVVLNSKTGGVSGDIILKQNGVEFARWHNGKLGIGTTTPTWQLQIVPTGTQNGLYVNAPEQSGAALDSVNIWHRSTGDALYIPHLGGVVPSATFTADTATGSNVLSNVSSFAGLTVGTKISGTGIPAGATIASAPNTPAANQVQISANASATNVGTTVTLVNGGAAGADSALNVLIPYYLDFNDGNGWTGTIQNNRTGMRGLTIVTEPVNDSESIAISHWANNFAVVIQNQQGGNAPGGQPTGSGGGLQILDSGVASSIQVNRAIAPTSGNAILEMITTAAGTWNAIKLWNGSSTVYALMDSTGFLGVSSFAVGGTVAPSAGTIVTGSPNLVDSGNAAYLYNLSPNFKPTNDFGKAAYGISCQLNVLDTTAAGNFTNTQYAGEFICISKSAAKTVNVLKGIDAQAYSHAAATVASAYAITATVLSDGNGTITTGRGLMVNSPTASAGSPITNNYGIFINDQKPTGVGTGYGIYINTQSGVALHIVSGNIELGALNFVLDTTTGTKFGTATSQKIGFFNATPIVQPSAVGTATGYAAGATVATFHSDDTYTGNTGSTAYTINGIVAALKNLGLIAA